MNTAKLTLAALVLTLGTTGGSQAGFIDVKITCSPRIPAPGPFQKALVTATGVGAASGAATGSPLGPAGSVLGAAGGAAIGGLGHTFKNHATKRWGW